MPRRPNASISRTNCGALEREGSSSSISQTEYSLAAHPRSQKRWCDGNIPSAAWFPRSVLERRHRHGLDPLHGLNGCSGRACRQVKAWEKADFPDHHFGQCLQLARFHGRTLPLPSLMRCGTPANPAQLGTRTDRVHSDAGRRSLRHHVGGLRTMRCASQSMTSAPGIPR